MRKAWIAATMTAAIIFIGAHTVSAGQTHPVPMRSYSVQAGDTLWSIAGSLRPGVDRREVVDDLMSFNQLSSPVIVPGQTLRLPQR